MWKDFCRPTPDLLQCHQHSDLKHRWPVGEEGLCWFRCRVGSIYATTALSALFLGTRSSRTTRFSLNTF